MLNANDDIIPKENRSTMIAQVIGYQQIRFLELLLLLLWSLCLYAIACYGIAISCIRATHLTSEETLPPLPIFQAMKIGLFLI